MRISVKYMAQLKQAAGIASEEVEIDSCTVETVIRRLGDRPAIRKLLLDADGRPQRALLVFIGDEQVASDSMRALEDGDQVTLLTPMAGG